MKKFQKKIILIQLNEINFDIARYYIKKNNLKNLKKIINFNSFKTFSEKRYEYLEPWIQWTSFSTGKTAEEHGIFRLGDITKSNIDQIYEKIESLGYKVGAICPMNVENKLKKPSFFISDPWTKSSPDNSWWSKKISLSLSRLINNNSEGKVGIKDIFILLLSIIRFSKFSNFFVYLKLFLNSFKKKYLKVFILELLITELSLSLIKMKQSDFVSIFYNGGAHIQHHYFFNSIAQSTLKNPNWYINSKEDPLEEILIFYDWLMSQYLDLKYELIFATGLQQVPYTSLDYYYRIRNHEKFLREIGLNYFKVKPRMTRDFLIEFDNVEETKNAENLLKNIVSVNNERIFGIVENRGKDLFVTLTFNKEISKNFLIKFDDKSINLHSHVVFVAIKNGMHDENGYIFTNINNIKKNKSFHIKDLHQLVLDQFSSDK